MDRKAAFFLTVLVGITLVAILEAHAVRQDHDAMRDSYGLFLAKKAGGKPLGSLIQPNSLAVFRSDAGVVGCALLRGK